MQEKLAEAILNETQSSPEPELSDTSTEEEEEESAEKTQQDTEEEEEESAEKTQQDTTGKSLSARISSTFTIFLSLDTFIQRHLKFRLWISMKGPWKSNP